MTDVIAPSRGRHVWRDGQWQPAESKIVDASGRPIIRSNFNGSGPGWPWGNYPELEAGRMGRRLGNWMPSRANVNTLIGASGRTVVARSRYLARNNGYAAGAVDCFAANLVGTGITPGWKLKEGQQELRDQIQDAWTAFVEECDYEAITDFYGLQRRIAREVFLGGECFVRKRPRPPSSGLQIPLQLELMPAEQLPTERNLWLENGNRVRQGIEYADGGLGPRVAYHFWKVHPGDITQSQNFGQIVVIPADEILHIHDPVECGQIRGLPKLTPSIVALWMLDAYDDAELERKKTAALFSIFIERQDPGPTMFNKLIEGQAQMQGAAGGSGVTAPIDLQPGVVHQLLDGEKANVAQPAEVGETYEVFQYRTLTKFCASVGLPYAGVTGDTVRANYGSQRAALLDTRRRMEALQFSMVVHQLCRTVAQWFLEAAVLNATLALPNFVRNPVPYRRIEWTAPPWDWIDPLKDRMAEVIAINAGLKPRSRSVQAEGYDPVWNDKTIAEDAKRASDLGLNFVGSVGQKQMLSEPPALSDDPNAKPGPDDNADSVDSLLRTAKLLGLLDRSSQSSARPKLNGGRRTFHSAETRTLLLIRHGATQLNSDDLSTDRIRGWTDVPLSEDGREEADRLGKIIADDPPNYLLSSDLLRAAETADIIAKAVAMPVSEKTQAFRPWDVGVYAGQLSSEAVPELAELACERPDETIKDGESFNSFRGRFFSGLADAFDRYGGVVAVVAHYRNDRLIESWRAAGFPEDGGIDEETFKEPGEGTGQCKLIEIPIDPLRGLADKLIAATARSKNNGHRRIVAAVL